MLVDRFIKYLSLWEKGLLMKLFGLLYTARHIAGIFVSSPPITVEMLLAPKLKR